MNPSLKSLTFNQAMDISKARGSYLGELGKTVGIAATLPIMAGVMQYLFARKDIKQELNDLTSSYNQIKDLSPKLSASPEAAAERFRELSAIAPTIAKNPKMAVKVMEPRLADGFSIDDIHKLTMIQAHARAPLHTSRAADRGTAMAGLVADRVFTTFGTQMVGKMLHEKKNLESRINTIVNSGGNNMKKESSPRISEECAVEMMADRFILWKQASAKDIVAAAKAMGTSAGSSSAVKAGLKNFGKGLSFFAAPLALAGIAHGVGAIMDARKKSQMDQLADQAFAKVKKESEIIKANPELALEAFDALKTFAPTLATKPILVKTFVEHSVDKGNIAPQTINELASAQGNTNRSKMPGFTSGFIGAVAPAMTATKSLMPNKEDRRLIEEE